MSLSVIVPTILDGPGVGEPLETVVRSARLVPGAEVLIVLNGPGPHWHGPVLTDPIVRTIRSDRPGPAAARNVGLTAARHPVVLFTDDDCLVPLSWCRDLSSGLHRAGAAAAAGPVGVEVIGPVTAFLAYQRVFDAPPLDAASVCYPVTASCALDRRRTGVMFNEEVFQFAAGEDVELGYQIRDAGGSITWLGNTPPVRQRLSEHMAQITGRFLRYGRSSALLYHRMGRSRETVPAAVDRYRALTTGQIDGRRRFREFADPRVRSVLASLELALGASWLAGYLDEMGSLLGHTIVLASHDRLAHAWQSIEVGLREMAEEVDWTAINPLAHALASTPTDTDDLSPMIASLLATHCPLSTRQLPDHVERTLNNHHHEREQAIATAHEQCARLGHAATTGTMTIDMLASQLRAAGIAFRTGMHSVERALATHTHTP